MTCREDSENWVAQPVFSDSAGDAIRESYLVFPGWTQRFWTMLTGKPLPGERPGWGSPPVFRALITIGFIVLATALHLYLLTSPDLKLVGVGFLLTPVFAVSIAGAWRKIQVVYVHHAVHKMFFSKWDWANEFVANLFTTLAVIQNPAEYRREHLEHHSRALFTTIRDADAALLYRFGLRPGRPVAELKKALLMTLFSPWYHLWFAAARLKSNLLTRDSKWAVVAAIWIVVLAIGLPWKFGVLAISCAVWLPLIVLYQMSALLQFTTEHVWLVTHDGSMDRDAYADRCVGRFCGERVPGAAANASSILAWAGWWIRTLFIHVPVRIGVIVGDLPAHDWHHLCGFVKQHPSEWPSAIYARQRAIDSGNSAGMERRELWGLPAMIQHVLTALSKARVIEITSSSIGDEVTQTDLHPGR